ncbi:NAD(P)/FAD-dependent oxidoreductase [Poritiphilus flavus]|uniref:FAD-binding protein n=1 Tax=Poritiphilus flavus TaxID=2697053 RepID=A0A6L9EF99_9FLAO|nr:NAD(P)/FAD-dependent oxidoreductase [Poritiphilus flavus]NAS13178.1 FAD-binding protein [Poritiphilus flavus]
MNGPDVIIVGGGLAGLSAAIHLSLEGFNVQVFEKQPYPRHKVCGEYLSREVEPYLEFLGIGLPGAVRIDQFRMSSRKGGILTARLPLGGFGISRYALDHTFYRRALELGVKFYFESVQDIVFKRDQFTVTSQGRKIHAAVVIGSYGKRSHLDKKLERSFIEQRSPWIGVKSHYDHPGFPEELVELHHFRGGYAGLSKTESGSINMCYLAKYEIFKLYKDHDKFKYHVLEENSCLRSFFKDAKPLFDRPLSIAQISFQKRGAVTDHVLMCGDSAGLIHPLCGNGMAMAIHSAAIAVKEISRFLKDESCTHDQLEHRYEKNWKKAFSARLAAGRRLQSLLLRSKTSERLIDVVGKSPALVRALIKSTHGHPMEIE